MNIKILYSSISIHTLKSAWSTLKYHTLQLHSGTKYNTCIICLLFVLIQGSLQSGVKFCYTSQRWFWHSLAILNLLLDINLPLHPLSSDNDEMCMLFASIQLWKGGNTACLTEVGGSTKSTVELGQVPLYRTNETTPVQLLYSYILVCYIARV